MILILSTRNKSTESLGSLYLDGVFHSLFISKITNHRWQCWQSYDCTGCESPRCAPPLYPPCHPPLCPPPCSRSLGPGPECSRGRSRSSRGSSLSSGWGWEQSIWNSNHYGEKLSVNLVSTHIAMMPRLYTASCARSRRLYLSRAPRPLPSSSPRSPDPSWWRFLALGSP